MKQLIDVEVKLREGKGKGYRLRLLWAVSLTATFQTNNVSAALIVDSHSYSLKLLVKKRVV